VEDWHCPFPVHADPTGPWTPASKKVPASKKPPQKPLKQLWPGTHCWQSDPPVPQLVLVLPIRQLPNGSQHPPQVAGEHVGTRQAPFWHWLPGGHEKHWFPRAPHANGWLPG
jgi:hypothetical protein